MTSRVRAAVALASAVLCSTEQVASADDSSAPCRPRRDRLGWLVPDFVKLQSGGFVGFATVGTGYSALADHVNLTALYGYVPATIGGTDIHSVAFTLTVRAPSACIDRGTHWVPLYAGGGALFGWGEGFFLRLPSRYPRNYYRTPTAVRGLMLAGSELAFEYDRASHGTHGPYVELTVVDVLFLTWLHNRRTTSFWDAAASTVGYKFAL